MANEWLNNETQEIRKINFRSATSTPFAGENDAEYQLQGNKTLVLQNCSNRVLSVMTVLLSSSPVPTLEEAYSAIESIISIAGLQNTTRQFIQGSITAVVFNRLYMESIAEVSDTKLIAFDFTGLPNAIRKLGGEQAVTLQLPGIDIVINNISEAFAKELKAAEARLTIHIETRGELDRQTLAEAVSNIAEPHLRALSPKAGMLQIFYKRFTREMILPDGQENDMLLTGAQDKNVASALDAIKTGTASLPGAIELDINENTTALLNRYEESVVRHFDSAENSSKRFTAGLRLVVIRHAKTGMIDIDKVVTEILEDELLESAGYQKKQIEEKVRTFVKKLEGQLAKHSPDADNS